MKKTAIFAIHTRWKEKNVENTTEACGRGLFHCAKALEERQTPSGPPLT